MIELSMKFQRGFMSDLQGAVKVMKKMKEGQASVCFPKLGDPVSWKLLVYSDAALANLCDGVSSMEAHLILLVNDKGLSCPLSWHAGKIKRVVRSTIAAEALSLLQGIEDAIYLRAMLADILGEPYVPIPLEAYVDNKSVVEAVHSTSMVDDKRLRLDVCTLKESLKAGEVQIVRWCPGTAQLANCMTKKGASGDALLRVFQSGRHMQLREGEE